MLKSKWTDLAQQLLRRKQYGHLDPDNLLWYCEAWFCVKTSDILQRTSRLDGKIWDSQAVWNDNGFQSREQLPRNAGKSSAVQAGLVFFAASLPLSNFIYTTPSIFGTEVWTESDFQRLGAWKAPNLTHFLHRSPCKLFLSYGVGQGWSENTRWHKMHFTIRAFPRAPTWDILFWWDGPSFDFTSNDMIWFCQRPLACCFSP